MRYTVGTGRRGLCVVLEQSGYIVCQGMFQEEAERIAALLNFAEGVPTLVIEALPAMIDSPTPLLTMIADLTAWH